MPIDKDFFATGTLKGPDDSLGFVLWRATHAWQRSLEHALLPTGLTHLRFAMLIALGWLTREGETVTQRRLADFMSVQPMQVSQVLVALEHADLVARHPSSSDRRALALTLTPAGEAALRQAMPIVEEAHREFFAKPEVRSAAFRKALLTLT